MKIGLMSGVRKLLRNIKNKMNDLRRTYGLLATVIILLLILFFTCTRNNSLKNEVNIQNQNVQALTDSIRISEDKVGNLEHSKLILISDKNKLKNLNKELDNELKKTKGKVSQLSKIVAEFETVKDVDTVYLTNELITYKKGKYGLKWEHDTIFDSENSRFISGESKFRVDSMGKVTPLFTIINQDRIKFNLVQGLREKGGKVEVFVKSDYPNFSVKELNSVIIDPHKHPVLKKFTKQKKFGVGPYIGVGITNKLEPTIQVGVGVQYSIFKF